ncbi:HAD family hydrolase [Algibacter sp. L4_22]|uniref:HAD family hydrolase n=1 Tax=Algibacter sp. L4_22 TaxID=2942477 RepID=UPI00201B46DF|nr:HAD-IA family hydrolase [Algibacter sp. L4_22]MCL5127869.1 HAD-IA family hydrolase [Algibacter sp. L4_22]
MTIKHNIVFVFDLDDTLYKEIDFLKSAYKEISRYISESTSFAEQIIFDKMISSYYNGDNPFQTIIDFVKSEDIKISALLSIYRNHEPDIILKKSHQDILAFLKETVYKIGLITDGRSIQQRNKLKSLGLTKFFDEVIISEEFGSEKPNVKNFNFYLDKYGKNYKYIYIGDNTKKDFIAPNALNWISICLRDNGDNIHKQTFDLEEKLKPLFVINSLKQIPEILKKIEKF